MTISVRHLKRVSTFEVEHVLLIFLRKFNPNQGKNLNEFDYFRTEEY